MSTRSSNEYLIAQLVAAVLIFVACGYFLFEAVTMPWMSALLPVAMLVAMMALSVALVLQTLAQARRGTLGSRVFEDHRRFLGALAIALVYVLAIAVIGFYPATAVMMPVTAALFGYRRPVGLAVATVVFVGGLALIFHGLMHRAFPAGLLFN